MPAEGGGGRGGGGTGSLEIFLFYKAFVLMQLHNGGSAAIVAGKHSGIIPDRGGKSEKHGSHFAGGVLNRAASAAINQENPRSSSFPE